MCAGAQAGTGLVEALFPDFLGAVPRPAEEGKLLCYAQAMGLKHSGACRSAAGVDA